MYIKRSRAPKGTKTGKVELKCLPKHKNVILNKVMFKHKRMKDKTKVDKICMLSAYNGLKAKKNPIKERNNVILASNIPDNDNKKSLILDGLTLGTFSQMLKYRIRGPTIIIEYNKTIAEETTKKLCKIRKKHDDVNVVYSHTMDYIKSVPTNCKQFKFINLDFLSSWGGNKTEGNNMIPKMLECIFKNNIFANEALLGLTFVRRAKPKCAHDRAMETIPKLCEKYGYTWSFPENYNPDEHMKYVGYDGTSKMFFGCWLIKRKK